MRTRNGSIDRRPAAVYPGSFDPVTNGHLDIIGRAARCFATLTVAVVANPNKQPLFSLERRVELLREVCADMPNVEVDRFSGLLVDYVRRSGARAIVKGLRIVSDFEHEFSMAVLNKKLLGEAETIFIPASIEYAYLSSSSVKEVFGLGGDVAGFVPPAVLRAMRAKSVRPVAGRKERKPS